MAERDFHVRVILEALDRGSNNLRRFFQAADKDVQRFRNDLRDVNKEVDLIFTSSGLRGRGARGQFLPVGDVEKAILRLRELREEAKGLSRETSLGRFFTGLAQGRREQETIRKAFRDRIELSKEAAQQEREELERVRREQRRQLDSHFFAERQALEENEILKKKQNDAALIREQRDLANAQRRKIEILEENLKKQGIAESKGFTERERAQERFHRNEILRLERERDAFIELQRERLRAAQQASRQEFDVETRTRRRQITQPDISEIFRKTREEILATRGDVDRLDSRIARFGRNAGASWSRFRTAVAIGRQELSDSDRAFLRTEGRLTRLGVAFGAATRGAAGFVNVRWAVIISFLQVFLTLIIQLGLALVALASSLIQAAAALGGAFLAGLTQIIPIVGLLAAAFSRLSAVLDAANLAEKLKLTKAEDQTTRLDSIKEATDRLSDARFALKRAAEAVSDSEFNLAQAGEAVKEAFKNQTEAIEALVEARRQAARDIVDANFEEREAALALAEAELNVLDAKQRLREENERGQLTTQNIEDARAQVREAQDRLAQARSEGDEAEITLALQQLNQAQQNLQQIQTQAEETQNNVKQAQIDIKQAEVNREQAIVRNKRAQEDAEEARRRGIQGSERVQRAEENLAQASKQIAQAERQQVLAQRALRDSIHGLTVAKREEQRAEEALTESQKKQTSQQEQLNQQLADLSPAERSLFRSIRRLQEVYKRNFRPITDIIISAFSRAVDSAVVILEDPRILTAASKLARSISGAIDALSEFAVTPEFRNFLVFTIDNAARNVPKITDAFIDLFRVLMRIATAATPLFNNLIDRFERWASRLEQTTRDTSGLERFFGTAGRHLDSWLAFFGAAFRILGIIIKFSAPAGRGLLDDLTDKLNEWSDWLNDNEAEVLGFFKNVRETVTALTRTLGQALAVLFKAFTSPEQEALTQFILEVLLPSFTLFLQILGKLAQGFIFLTEIPLLGNLIKFTASIIIVEKLFNRLIPATQKLTNLFFTLIRAIAGGRALAGISLFVSNLRGMFALMRTGTPALVALEAAFPRLAAAIVIARNALISLGVILAAHPVLGAILGITAAIIILDQKFHFLGDTLRDLQNDFLSVFNFINTRIDDFIVNPIKSAINKASSFLGFGEIFSLGRDIGDDIKEGARVGLTGLGTDMSIVLRREFDQAESQVRLSANRIINSLSSLRSLVSDQLQQRLFGEVPAEKELAALEAKEAQRAREQRGQEAAQTVKDAQKNLNARKKDVEKAEKAITAAITNEERKRARENFRLAKQAQRDAQKQLEDALKQQAETKHQSDVDLERERLRREAERQRESLERSVRAEEKRADALFSALRKALRNKDWQSVQKIFDRIVDLIGIQNLGKASADAFVEGLIFQLKLRQKDITKATVASQKQAQVEAEQQTIAGKIIGASSQQELIAKLKKQGQSEKGILSFLINSGLIDLELAYAILAQVDDKSDLNILRRMFANLGIDQKPASVLRGRSAEEYLKLFLKNHPNQDRALDAFAAAVRDLKLFAHGGTVPGGTGQAVPIIAHAGEWVLNKAQQAKLAQSLGMGLEQIKMWLFGTNMGQGKPGPQTTGTKPTTKEQGFRGTFFNLVPQVDPDGVVVWFIEMDDGAFGQVSPRDAKRIKASGGNWIPGYVKRSTHGYTQKFLPPQLGRGLASGGVVQKFLKGGVVLPGFAGPMLQSFAEGGTVLQQSGFGASTALTTTKEINQHFEVTANQETDWNYILRLGAIHAQSGYT